MNNIREKLEKLISEIITINAVDNGEFIEVEINRDEIFDHLIANGVTFAKDTNVPDKMDFCGELCNFSKGIINRLRKEIEELQGELIVEKTRRKNAVNAYNELKANGVTVQEWIPASEPPDEFVSVLGHITNAGQFPSVRECYFVRGGFFFPALLDSFPIDNWMPIPEPPKGE